MKPSKRKIGYEDDFIIKKNNELGNKENIKYSENNIDQPKNNEICLPKLFNLPSSASYMTKNDDNMANNGDNMTKNVLETSNYKTYCDLSVLNDLRNEECNLVDAKNKFGSVSDDVDKLQTDINLVSDDDENSLSNDNKMSVFSNNVKSLYYHNKYGIYDEESLESDKSSYSREESEGSMTRKPSLLSEDLSETTHSYENETKEAKIKYLREIPKLIQKVNLNGEESIGGEATELPTLPGLYIKSHGYVPLPLCGENADSLIRVFKQAPYGLKHQTLVDTSVRDTYQINPDEFEIKNPQWNSSLSKLVERVAIGLGCTSRVEAKLYKLLLYKEGGHFKRHRDTEKEKQMFGTLVLQLPSIHEGGELVVYHKSESTLYDFGQMTKRAPYHPQFVAHYADVEHEILPVKSGYRLALIYSLCWIDGNGDHDLKDLEEVLEKLSCCFMFFSDSDDCNAIKLNHKYTTSSLKTSGVKALKGIDNFRFNLLKNANSRLSSDKKMSFFIARANLVIKSYDTTVDWEEYERISEIDKWYSVCGHVYEFSDISINIFTHVIDPDSKSRKPFAKLEDESKWAESDFEEEIEYTGNEGTQKTTTYHKYLLVFLPKKFEITTFFKIKMDFAVSILYNEHYLEENPDCLTILSILVNKFTENNSDHINYSNITPLNHYSDHHYSDHHLNNDLSHTSIQSIIEMCCKLKTFDNLNLFLTCKQSKFLKKLSFDNIKLIIKSFSWCLIQETLKEALVPVTFQNLENNCNLVQTLFENKEEKNAVECFMFCVAPILDIAKEFTNQVQPNTNRLEEDLKKKKKALFKLATTILKLNQVIDTSELTKKFCAFMKLVDQRLLQKVLKLFIKMELFKNSSHVIDLFVFCSEYLAAKLKETPKFSWSMPGSIRGYPQIDRFFRSELQNFKYTGVFSGIRDARKFAKEGQNQSLGSSRFVCGTDFSATFEPNGIGKNAYVLITKTKFYFESILAEYANYRKLHNDINCYIKSSEDRCVNFDN